MNYFKTAKFDSRTKVITIVILLLFVFFPVSTFFFEPPRIGVSIAVIVLMLLMAFISFGMIPKRIAVSHAQILIKNLFGAILINMNQIESVTEQSKSGLNHRTFGVGGLFGYFGYFNGGQIWYVTNRNKKVIIKLKSGKTYVISPENPYEFVKTILSKHGTEVAI